MESLEKPVGAGHLQLIERLKLLGVIKDPLVEQAMKTTDRMDFMVAGTSPALAYEDCPQPIGYGATISAPHMHAYALVSTIHTQAKKLQ